MKKKKIYLESTIISYVASSERSTRDKDAEYKRGKTLVWWRTVLPLFDAFVSPFVFEEILRGDPEQAKKRAKIAAEFSALERTDSIDELAIEIFKKTSIPEKSKIDAYHLAAATMYEMNYLISWNMDHIANEQVRQTVRKINENRGLKTPRICTPLEPMEV